MRRVHGRTVMLTAGLLLGATIGARAQLPPTPGAADDVRQLAGQMTERVQRLADDAAADLRQSREGRHLYQDIQELAQSLGEFRDSQRGRTDNNQARQTYTGIDGTWHHLRTELAGSGISTPRIAQAVQRVDEVDARLHQALGLNVPPPALYGSKAPTGVDETQRLAYALENRANSLASVIQVDVPKSPELSRDATQLAQACDTFYDSIQQGQTPDVVQAAYGPVAALSEKIGRELKAQPIPARVQKTWEAYASAESLLRQSLNLPAQAGALPAGGATSVAALADRLVGEVEAFLQVFSQTAGVTPQGGFFLADAQRLRDAAVNFREDAAAKLPANQLAFEFRDVDYLWQILARRTARIARGRMGPNIQQVYKMGDTVAEIHQLLGMPGYPPAAGPAPVAVPAPGVEVRVRP